MLNGRFELGLLLLTSQTVDSDVVGAVPKNSGLFWALEFTDLATNSVAVIIETLDDDDSTL